MIHGIGTDILRISRMEDFLARQGQRGVERILTIEEQAEFAALSKEQGARFLAKRFAAKEAFAKAMGTGIRGDVGFASVAVDHHPSGQPFLRLLDPLAARLRSDGLALRPHLSLSDDGEYVIAYVILERT